VILVYGDCGTGRQLDQLLALEGVRRVAASLNLPLEIRPAGYGALETRVLELMPGTFQLGVDVCSSHDTVALTANAQP
jgi:hypothetical protein